MTIQVELLLPKDEEEYEATLKTDEHALLYGSIKYRNLLRRVVNGEDYYLLAKEGGQTKGVFPTFLKRNPKYGNILNSLPFYGSNGGPICSPDMRNKEEIKRTLLNAFHDLAREKEAILSTFITSPFDNDTGIYEKFASYDYRDARIGQICTLPSADSDLDSALMSMFHPPRRRNIRKAYKQNVRCRHSKSTNDLRFLADVHKQNIEAVGGLAKGWEFFQLIPEIFEYDTDYRVYIAELDNKPISALLLFYYHRTVEYFTPATAVEYRTLQPSSLLVFEAMKDAARRGFRYWNFGGTWLGQTELHRYKKRWGAEDFSYSYYTKAYRDISPIKSLGKGGILQEYPYFYTIPFSELNK